MENEAPICCWIVGRNSSFPVYISPEKTIGQLKEALIETKPNRFLGIDPDELQVFVAGICDTKTARDMFECQGELAGMDKIAKHIPDGFTEDKIAFAIKQPRKQHSFILNTFTC
jgi:hypothetical protein